MTGTIAFEILIILLLILANGWLARSEMAVVSAKRVRLQRMAQDGNGGSRKALRLLDEPSDFLASVQIGITLIGVLAGAFGGATISEELENAIQLHLPSLYLYAEGIAVACVVVAITFFSLILGELVPKRLALAAPEHHASSSASVLLGIALISKPAVHFLSFVTEGVLKAIGFSKTAEPPLTEDEVDILVDQGTEAGVFGASESSIIKRAMRLGDLRVSHLMTPRTRVLALDITDSLSMNLEKIAASQHTYYPVIRRDWSEVLGVVSGKLLLRRYIANEPPDLLASVLPPLFLSETTPADSALEKFRESGTHVAVVIDEHGGVAGMVTLADTIEALVGDFPQENENQSPIVKRDDGSYLVDGLVTLPDLGRHFEVDASVLESSDFQTLGGLIMHALGEMPREGAVVDFRGFRFEIVDMDGHRIDKVIVSRAVTHPVI